jgi:hypothetical protein
MMHKRSNFNGQALCGLVMIPPFKSASSRNRYVTCVECLKRIAARQAVAKATFAAVTRT